MDCDWANVTDVETVALKGAGRYHLPHRIPRRYWWSLDLLFVASNPPLWSVFTTLLCPL